MTYAHDTQHSDETAGQDRSSNTLAFTPRESLGADDRGSAAAPPPDHELVDDTWHPPQTFRVGLATTEHLARTLLQEIRSDGALLVPAHRLDFLARRLVQLTSAAHQALPPEVE